MPDEILTFLLRAAAVGQLAICGINLQLDRLLKWEAEIAQLPVLMRQVHHVHKWFISITLAIFAVLTLRFAPDMASGMELARWLAAGIGIFWLVRTAIQWVYYDQSLWRGQTGRTAVHWILTISYGGAAIVYLFAALRN